MTVTLKDLSKVDVAYNPTGGRYVMALDSGTTSVRAVIVDEYDCIVAQASRRIKTFYPRPGWVEQDPMEILASQIAVMMEVQFKSGIHSDRIAAIGITNQRETTVVWDRDSGLPVHNAIVWQCRRTSEITDALIADGMSDIIRDKTGLMPDPYFSGTKIKWILDNVDGARAAADAGELMFGTIDTWLIYNLTGGMVHATDYTNASRTMLFNIHTLEWDDELLELARRSAFDAAGGQVEFRRLRQRFQRDYDVRPLDHRRCGRPAGLAVRSLLLQARMHEEHLRHGLFHAHEHRRHLC